MDSKTKLMDIPKLQKFFTNGLFTDLTLILQDDVEKITLNVHKIVLSMNCEYFEKLLTNCQEKNANVITMRVTNASIMQDIIMSFYGEIKDDNNCRYHLEKIKCLDFLGLAVNLDYFQNNIVTKQDFDLLLDVIDIVGYDTKTVNILSRNIPEDYDLSLLPRELLQEMLGQETGLKIAVNSRQHNKLQLWNRDDKQQKSKIILEHESNQNCHVMFLSKGEKLAWVLADGSFHTDGIPQMKFENPEFAQDGYTISVFDNIDGVLQTKFENPEFTQDGYTISLFDNTANLYLSEDEKTLVSCINSRYNLFAFWNCVNGKRINMITLDSRIIYVRFFGNKIISYHRNGDTITWDRETGEQGFMLSLFSYKIDMPYISPNGQQVAFLHSNQIEIVDLFLYKTICIINTSPNIMLVVWSPCCKYIAFSDNETIWLNSAVNGNEIFQKKLIDGQGYNTSVIFSPDSQKIIISVKFHIYIINTITGEILEQIFNNCAANQITCHNYLTLLGKKMKKILNE